MKSKRRKSTGADKTARLSVLQRALFRCERCYGSLQGVAGMSLHHRRARGMGGTSRDDANDPSNLIALCGSGTTGCHGWVESNRDEARSLGLLLYQTDDPQRIPFTDCAGRSWVLTSDCQKIRFTA